MSFRVKCKDGTRSVGEDHYLLQFISDSKRYFLFISSNLVKYIFANPIFNVKIVQNRGFNLRCNGYSLQGVQVQNDVLIIY